MRHATGSSGEGDPVRSPRPSGQVTNDVSIPSRQQDLTLDQTERTVDLQTVTPLQLETEPRRRQTSSPQGRRRRRKKNGNPQTPIRRLQKIHYVARQRNDNGRVGGPLRVIKSRKPIPGTTDGKTGHREETSGGDSAILGQSKLEQNKFNGRRRFAANDRIKKRRKNIRRIIRNKTALSSSHVPLNDTVHPTLLRTIQNRINKRPIDGQTTNHLNDTSITLVADMETLSLVNMSLKVDWLNKTLTVPPKIIYVNGSRTERHFRIPPRVPQSYIIHKRTKICIYEGVTYRVGDKVPTAEPCLECLCYERTIICGLRVCPKSKILEGHLGRCQVTQTEGKCCPDIVCSERVGEFEAGPPGTDGSAVEGSVPVADGTASVTGGTDGSAVEGYVPVADDTASVTGGTVLGGKVSLHGRDSDNISTDKGPQFRGNDKRFNPVSSAPDRGHPAITVVTPRTKNSDKTYAMLQLSLESSRNDGLENTNINNDDSVSRKPIIKRRKNKISNNLSRNSNKGLVPTKVNDIDNISRINAVLSRRNSSNTNNSNKEGTAAQEDVGEVSSLSSSTTTTNSLTNNNSSSLQQHFREGKDCLLEGTLFAEGSAIPGTSECTYCFCIKGSRSCVAHKCLLPMEGCRPRYRAFTCCPSYYDCHEARLPVDQQLSGKALAAPLVLKVGSNAAATTTTARRTRNAQLSTTTADRITDTSATTRIKLTVINSDNASTISDTSTTISSIDDDLTTGASTEDSIDADTTTASVATTTSTPVDSTTMMMVENTSEMTTSENSDDVGETTDVPKVTSCLVKGVWFKEGAEVPLDSAIDEETIDNIFTNGPFSPRVTDEDSSTVYFPPSTSFSLTSASDKSPKSFGAAVKLSMKNFGGLLAGNPCRSCFCFGGSVRCQTQDCDAPPEGCRPVWGQQGRCCPVKYDCDGSSDQKTPRLLDTSTPVEIINDNSQLNKDTEEPEAEPEPDNPISTGQDDQETIQENPSDQEAIQENPSNQDPLAEDYSSDDPSSSTDAGADGEEEDYQDEAEEEGETSQNSRTRTRGGASSRRTLSTLMRKRAQQQRGGNREQAAERAQAYYERHGIHVLTEQKEETKPGTKRYKLRNKPPPSRLQERRRQQQQRNKERQEQKERYPLDDAIEDTPTVDQTKETNPVVSGSSTISQSLSRREQLSQKRKLKKQQQEQQRKQQLEEEKQQQQQEQEQQQIEEEIIQPLEETQAQQEERESQNNSESVIQEQSNQPETVADVVPEVKVDTQADDLAKLAQQEEIEQQKQSEDEARRKRLEIRKRLMLMRQKQQQNGEEPTATDQETQAVLEQILSLSQPDNQQATEGGDENQGVVSNESEEVRRVHQQVLLEQLEQLNKKMQEELATASAAADDVTASVVQSSQTPQEAASSLPPKSTTESMNDSADGDTNVPELETHPGTDSSLAEDLGKATDTIIADVPQPETQPGTDSAPENLGIAADEIIEDVPEPETQPDTDSASVDLEKEIFADLLEPESQQGTDLEPAEDLIKAVDEIVADVGVESAVESAQETEPSASEGDASETQPDTDSASVDLEKVVEEISADLPEPESQQGTDLEPAEDLIKAEDEIVAEVGVESAVESASTSSRRPGYKRPTFKRPFFKRPTLATNATANSKVEDVLQSNTRRTVPPPRRPSLFRRKNTKQTTIATSQPEAVSEGTPSTPASAQQRPRPFGIANQMRIKRPTLFRDRQREETSSTEPHVAQEAVTSTTGQAEIALNRANSKFKDPEFVERTQVFHIRKPSDDEETPMEGQDLHNLTLDEASELYPVNPHLQYIEDDPDEIFQFEDTILEEVTVDYVENISEGPFGGTTIDVTAQETQRVNEIPLAETKGPMTWTTVMLNSEYATTELPNNEEVTDTLADEFVTRFDHESTLKNKEETPEIVETTEEIATDSIQESTTLKNMEPTEYGPSIFTDHETISDTEDQVVTTTQISTELSTDSQNATTPKKSYTFTARPFRYSLYNKRPGSKLQEIMSRRTAPTSAPTSTISAGTETMTQQTVTESVQESDPETIKSISTVDETSPTEGYETSDVDVTEPTTEASDDRMGAQFELKQGNKSSTPEIPVVASSLITVTTGPVIYVDPSTQGVEDQTTNIGTSTESPILNIADEIERLNIFHGSEGATTNQDIPSTVEVNDYAILGAIKNVIAASHDPLTTSSSIGETGTTDNAYEVNTDNASEINTNQSIPATVDEIVTQGDVMYSDEPAHHEDYYEYYHTYIDNVTDPNFEYASDYDHMNESAIDYTTTVVAPANDVIYEDAHNYGIDVTREHNNTDYYDIDITGMNNNSDYYEYYYDYLDMENSTGITETTEIVLTESEPHSADTEDLSDISDMPEGVAILTDGFFYPNQPVHEDEALEENTPLEESQSNLTVTDQQAESESSSPTDSSSLVPREEVKVSTGFLIKDTPYINPEKLYGATDIQVNQVRTDRKNTLNSQENSQLQEMMIQNENNPNAPPVKLLVSNNFGRISAGDQDTFDISVSSSLFTGDSEPKQRIRVGQVIPVAIDEGNTLNSDTEEREEGRQAAENEPVVDNIEEQPAENEQELGVGIGQVIPVDLTEDENVTEVEDETNDVPPPPPLPPTSSTSFLGTLFNMFTRPERPRPKRPNRPGRPRPQPPRKFLNGTGIEGEDMASFTDQAGNRPIRPTIFRPPRPNHPYRPFRPTGFRPPRPDLQPPLELEGTIGADSDGASSADAPMLHSAIRPNLEFENRPLFEPNPDDSSTPQLVDRPRPPFAGARPDLPNRPPFRPPSQFRPPGPLRPPPPPAFSLPNENIEDIENEAETEEPTTLLPSVSSDSDSSGALDVKVIDLLPETEIEDAVREESLDTNADPNSEVEVKTMTSSDIPSERISTIPSVIEIKGPLDDFINQLKDGPEQEGSDSPHEIPVEHSTTETTSTTSTTTEQPDVTGSRVPIESADSIIEKELITKVSNNNMNELEITPPDYIYESESATESLAMVKEESLPIETGSMLEIEISTDEPFVVDQSINTLQPEPHTEIKLEPSTHSVATTNAHESSSEHSIAVTKQSTTLSIEEEATPTILPIEAIFSSTMEITADSSTTSTSTTTQTTPLPTSPVDNEYIEEADKEESLPKDETVNVDVEESYLQDDFYDPLESYDNYVASDNEEDYYTSSTGSLPSSSSTTSVTPPEPTQTSPFIQDERYEPHGVTSEKTTPHPYHNIPDGSFVSSSHLYSDSPDANARIPRPRPTVVLPGSRPGLPIKRPTDFPKRPTFERPRPVNQEVVLNEYQGPPPRPFIETGFQGLRGEERRAEERPEEDKNVREEIIIEAEKGPTLPPSLPNLQIIPFVAADAVKKADDNLAVESVQDGVREVVLPPDFLSGAPIPGQHELCWENGRILGNGVPVNYTKDACQSCRCYFGQLICQNLECQEVPAHCQGVMQPGECCPMIVCEHEIKEGEKVPHNIDTVSAPSENEFINQAASGDYSGGSLDYVREPSDYTEEGDEEYLLRGNQDDYSQDVDQEVKPIQPELTTPSSPYPVHPASRRPPLADRFLESNKPFGGPGKEDRRPLIPNRFADSDRRQSPPFRNSPPVDRSDIPPLRRKPSVGGGGTRPTLPFILRNRPGGRPSFIPPRKPSFFQSTTTRIPSSTTERIQEVPLEDESILHGHERVSHDDGIFSHGDERVPHGDEIVSHDDGIFSHGDERVPHGHERVSHDDGIFMHGDERVSHGDERVAEIEAVEITSSTTTTTTTTEIQPLVVPEMSTTSKPFLSDFDSFLAKVGSRDETRPNFLLPRPILQTTALESAEIENLLLRDDFQFGQDQRPSGKPVKQPVKPLLPDIPESVKSQLPLGIDAIMASGMFQLSGCNIYGREYNVGESIKELSATCKACRCTPVGVQCLPTC